jgi:hypothetical protein
VRRLLLGLLFLVLPAPAAAAGFEAVWSFHGGQVAVHARGAGHLEGVVIRKTTDTSCPYEVGQPIWSGIHPVGDGSFRGSQRLQSPPCATGESGDVVFRVLTNPDGAEVLRMCSEAGGCADLAAAGSLPTRPPWITAFSSLPKARGCWDFSFMYFDLFDPPNDALRTARIYLNGRRIAVWTREQAGRRVRVSTELRFRERFRVTVIAKTYLGHTLRGTRHYRMCESISQVGDGPT